MKLFRTTKSGKRFLTLLLAFVMCIGMLPINTSAALLTGEAIKVLVCRAYSDGSIIESKYVQSTCRDSSPHSGYNHSMNANDVVRASGYTGYKQMIVKRYGYWGSSTVGSSSCHYNVTGSAPYKADESIWLIYDRPHNHSYSTFLYYSVQPTCYSNGTAVYQCSCGATSTQTVYASEAYHTWGSWQTYNSTTEIRYCNYNVHSETRAATVTNVKLTYMARGSQYRQDTYTKGATATVVTCTNSHTGYRFLGWSSSSSATTADYEAGDTFRINNDMTLHAVWQKTSTTLYELIYDANGGTICNGSAEIERQGVTSTAATCNFVVGKNGIGEDRYIASNLSRSGYRFLGWADTKTATVPNFEIGDIITLTQTTPTMTLFAVWQKVNPITLTYNANGGSLNGIGATDTQMPGADGKASFTLRGVDAGGRPLTNPGITLPTKDGYEFYGWFTSAINPNGSYRQSPYEISADATLYAVWAKQYNIICHANGGQGKNGETDVVLNQGKLWPKSTYSVQIYYQDKDMSRPGYIFKGWATTPDATEAQYQGYGKVTLTESNPTLHLYAVWEKDPTAVYTVIYTDGTDSWTGMAKAFPDQIHRGLESGTPTPAFEGTPTRKNYRFDGWDKEIADTVIENVIYTAKWTQIPTISADKDIKITFVDGHTGEDFGVAYVKEGKDVYATLYPDAPDHSGEGYKHIGWSDPVRDADGNYTITANYEANTKYTITYHWGHPNFQPDIYDFDLPAPEEYEAGTVIDLTQKFPTGVLDKDGNKIVFDVVENITSDWTKTYHYTWAGWADSYLGAENVSPILDSVTMPAKDIHVYARFDGKDGTSSTVDITDPTYVRWVDGYTDAVLDKKDILGTVGNAPVVPLPYPEDPTREGYIFMGWSEPVKDSEEGENKRHNYTITAQWQKEDNSVTLTYHANGGDETCLPEAQTADKGENGKASFTLDEGISMQKDGYSFKGWSLQPGSKELLSSPFEIDTDTTVYAVWECAHDHDDNGFCNDPDCDHDGDCCPKYYTVTWIDSYDNETLKSLKVRSDSTSTITQDIYPDLPTHEGKEFVEWVIGTPDEDGNYTITATWKDKGTDPEPGTHLVIWVDGYNNTTITPREVKDGVTVPESEYPTVPVHRDRRFVGWSVGEPDENGNITITANWSRNTGGGGNTGGSGGNGGGGSVNSGGGTGGGVVDIQDPTVPLASAPGLNNTDHFAYIIGYVDGTVRPEAYISRAEVATIFFRLMTEEFRGANWSTQNNFSDVAGGSWYNNAISTGTTAGIIRGYADGTFAPDANITRAEFAAIASRFLSDETAVGSSFTDIAGHWAESDINRAVTAGWIRGRGDNRFAPDDYITRAEVMTLVNRMLDRVGDKEAMLDDMVVWSDNMDENVWYYADVQEATNGHEYTRDELGIRETWTKLTENRDWSELEK